MKKARTKDKLTFNGKVYKLDDLYYPNKYIATVCAKSFRREGHYARVLETPDGWVVYIR